MEERDPPRVERMAREGRKPETVHGIAGDRPAAGGQVHPDLVPASGHQTAPEHRPARARVVRQALEAGEAPRAVVTNHSPAAIGRIGAERQIDLSPLRFDTALDDGYMCVDSANGAAVWKKVTP